MSDAAPAPVSPEPVLPTPHGGRGVWLAVLAVVGLNVAAYALLATDTAQRAIGSVQEWAYPGAFVLSLVTNATVAVPVPYNPIVLQLMAAVDYPYLIAVLAAAGAALGETTGWWVGSRGRAVLPTAGRTGAVVRWLHRVSVHRRGSFWALVGFSAIPNPAFDIAGLVAGAAKVRYLDFVGAAFLGRLLRFAVFAAVGQQLLALWPF